MKDQSALTSHAISGLYFTFRQQRRDGNDRI